MIDSAAIEIIRVLQQAGHQALIVGGAARDMMMGIPPHDYDIATSARPEEVQKLFQQTYAVGAQFGVIIVVMDNRHFEVATFRSDGAYEDGRRPADVQYCGAREDAQRRDFTINALMYDPIADEWYDYVNGQQDLQDKRIRAIGNPIMRFEEDHLRILRAFRFCFRFGFKIEKETLAAIQRLAPLTAAVSSERTSEELTRIFTGPRPGEALWALKKFGVLEHVLPEVAAMHGVPQPKEFHPEGDVLRHTCLTLDATLQLPAARRTPELAWSALLHDIGKPATITHEDRIRFNGHSHKGAALTQAILRRLRFPKTFIEKVAWQVENHMRINDLANMRAARRIRLLRRPDFPLLLDLHQVDSIGSMGTLDSNQKYRRMYEEEMAKGPPPEPLLTGHDLIRLGYRPGPRFAEILESIETERLEERLDTPESAEAYVIEHYPR